MHLKLSSMKWRPFRKGGDELIDNSDAMCAPAPAFTPYLSIVLVWCALG